MIAAMLDFLTFALCAPYSETTDGGHFDVLLEMVANHGRTIFRLFQVVFRNLALLDIFRSLYDGDGIPVLVFWREQDVKLYLITSLGRVSPTPVKSPVY